jgi:hypothetical protein
MTGIPYLPVRQTPVNGSGRPYPGAKAYFYRAGTTTLQTVYSNSALTTAHANPVIANSAGKFAAIYLDPTYNYRVILQTSAGVTLSDDDNVPSTLLTQGAIGLALYPRTAAEISASVTPSDYGYPPGDVRRYGATTSGDNSTAFTSAYAQAAQAGGQDVYATGGPYAFTAAVILPNANTRIYGDATLTSADAITNGIFYQTNRGVLTEIEGLTCTGASPLFKRYATDTPLPWTDHYLEYRIHRVNFMQDATSYGAYFYGAREGSFSQCHFETCKGVYSDYSINMEFIGCTGKNAVQFVEAASGSEGIKFIGGTALGMTYCVKATGVLGIQVGNVMWDYCDNPIALTGCQQVGIANSYITSRSTSAHVIHIIPNGATRSDDITIVGNPQLANVCARAAGTVTAATKANPGVITVVGHGLATNDKVVFASVGGMTELNTGGVYTATVLTADTFSIGVDTSGFTTFTSGGTATEVGTGRIINIDEADYIVIADNQIKLWAVEGVYLDDCTQVKVHDNVFTAYPGTGTYSVQTATADSSVVIHNNTVGKPIETVTTRSVRHNTGYVTENSGEATFTAGATSRTVAHGLAKAPLKGDVKLTTTSTLGTATEIWVSAVDATNITLTTDVDPVTNVTVSWAARVSVG